MDNKRSKQSFNTDIHAWSNKFKVSNNALVDVQKNSKLQCFLDPINMVFGSDVTQFIKALKSVTYCKYQSDLLKAYLQRPEHNSKLDLDKLTLTIDCTAKDIEHILDPDKGVTCLRSKQIASVLKVVSRPVGYVNNGGYDKHRPLYVKCFLFKIMEIDRKEFRLYVAKGETKGRPKIGIRIDFIPDRFTGLELNIIFSHLRSVLTANRYKQLMKHAKVTRADVGLNMFGVQSIYAIATLSDKGYKKGKFYPKTIDAIVETVYLGDIENSSHFLIYEKILKEIKLNYQLEKKFKEIKSTKVKPKLSVEETRQLIAGLAVTARLERRYRPSKTKLINATSGKPEGFLLRDLDKALIALPMVQFIDPMIFPALNRTILTKLLIDKALFTLKKLEAELADLREEYPDISLDNSWFEASQLKMLNYYKQLIMEPETIKSAEIRKIKLTCSTEIVEPSEPIEVHVQPNPSTDYQKLAITTDEQYVLVEAGAGTGKTTTMSKRVEFLLHEKQIAASKIRVITFTNVAAGEIGSRLKQSKAEGVVVSTFHSWCLSMLYGIDGKYRSYTMLDDSSQLELLTEVFDNTVSKKVHNLSASDIRDAMSYQVNTQKKPKKVLDTWSAKATSPDSDLLSHKELVKETILSFKKHKKDHELLDFDDLMLLVYKQIKNNKKRCKSLSGKYKYLQIDEVQDTNQLQWNIILLLLEQGSHLYCVGDPAQTIFGFRGSDFTKLDDFTSMVSDGVKLKLINNYRSTPEILQLTNWVRTQMNPNYSELIPTQPSGSKPMIYDFSEFQAVVKWIKSDIKIRIKAGEKSKNIAVITRTNKQVDSLNTALEELGVEALTVHKAKGIERETCYVIDSRFTFLFSDNQTEDRQLYVALTRAEKQLIICRSNSGRSGYSGDSSGEINLLDRLPEDLYDFSS